MAWVLFPLCCWTWGQTMVEVMKIMVTSFKTSHACTAALSVTNPAAGHCQPTPLLETPGHSLESLCQSLVGSLLLSPGFWCTQYSVYALQESISYYCGQESLRRSGVAIIVNKRFWNAVQFSSVAQSCPTLWDPMNGSMPGLFRFSIFSVFISSWATWVRILLQLSIKVHLSNTSLK